MKWISRSEDMVLWLKTFGFVPWLQAGIILAVSRRVFVFFIVKFEIPMALQRPCSTSFSMACNKGFLKSQLPTETSLLLSQSNVQVHRQPRVLYLGSVESELCTFYVWQWTKNVLNSSGQEKDCTLFFFLLYFLSVRFWSRLETVLAIFR